MDTKSKRRVMSLTVDERRERRNSLNRVARFRLKEAVTIPARKRRKVNYDGSRLDIGSKEESYEEVSEEESGQNPTVLSTT